MFASRAGLFATLHLEEGVHFAHEQLSDRTNHDDEQKGVDEGERVFQEEQCPMRPVEAQKDLAQVEQVLLKTNDGSSKKSEASSQKA